MSLVLFRQTRPRYGRALRVFLVVLVVGIAGALVCGGYLISRMGPIGTAYAAKILCSGVFVSGRAADVVIREDIIAENHPLIRFISANVDRERNVASASFLGMMRREAAYRPGLGCTLAIGVSPDRLTPLEGAATTVASEDDLPVVPASAGVNAAQLNAALDWAFSEPDPDRLRRTRAVIVMHEGRIVAERYAPGFSADMPMLGWSMAKCVTGALIGVLVQDAKLATDSKALLPQWRDSGDARAGISLDNLLRMSSGLHFGEHYQDPVDDVLVMLFATADAASFAADKPLDTPPGTHFQYSSGTTNILARVIRDALDGSEQDYLKFPRRALFNRIGMRHAVIESDASGGLIGSSFMYASPRDWARFGEFLRQDGSWYGERILPPGWVQYMATLTTQSTHRNFGAHLWVKVPPPFNSVAVVPPVLPDAYHAVGYEGQFVSVIPSRNLVVVRLGLSRRDHSWDQEEFLSRILEAFPG